MAQNLSNNTVFMDEANSALSIISPLVMKILIAIVMCFVGFVIGKIVQSLILKFFKLSDLDRIFRKKTGLKMSLSLVVSTIAAYFIYLFAIVMALNTLEIATTIITTIVIILVIFLLLFMVFGLNDVFANFSAGVVIQMKGNLKPGDYIRIKDKHIEGYIVSMNSLNMRLETKNDETVFIPNMAVFRSDIIKPKKIPK